MAKMLPLIQKAETRAIVEEICSERGVDFQTYLELIEAEYEQQGKLKKRGISEEFDDILSRIKVEDY